MKEKNLVICPDCGEDNEIKNETCYECKSSLLLNNKYHLIKVLGENIGITYVGMNLCIHPITYVVIKELPIKSVDRWKTEELFKREGNILKSLDHKAIPKFIEQFTLEINKKISYFLVMELIEGITIEEELANKIYNEEEVFSFIKEVTETLSYLQSFRPPVVHRDIKPSNLIRKSDGSIAIIDFGGVKDAIKPNIGSTVAGTFGYASPEQILGKAVIQSDFYSLGITALVLLTKKEINDLASNLDLNTESYEFLSNKMALLIDKLIANNVEDRFRNTNEVIEFIDSENIIEDRKLNNKQIISSSGNEIEDFLNNYDRLDRMWKTVKKRKDTFKYFWAILMPVLIFFLIKYIWNPQNLGGFAYGLFILYSVIAFSYKKSNLNKFLDNVFKDDLLKNIEIETIYSFYEGINNKKRERYGDNKERGLFTERILEENKKDEFFFKDYIDEKNKVILDNTKLSLYKQAIIKHRGKDGKKVLS